MPTRATLALIATVVGLFLLFSFKTPDFQATRPSVIASASPRPSSSTPSASSTPAASGGSPNPPPTTTPPPTPTAGTRDGTYTGQDYPNEFGDVQVSITISGGRITNVQALQLPSDRQRSAYISQQAGPILHDQVLQAQSAQIDGVSGATYTSSSYAQSVQSALDQAHA